MRFRIIPTTVIEMLIGLGLVFNPFNKIATQPTFLGFLRIHSKIELVFFFIQLYMFSFSFITLFFIKVCKLLSKKHIANSKSRKHFGELAVGSIRTIVCGYLLSHIFIAVSSA